MVPSGSRFLWMSSTTGKIPELNKPHPLPLTHHPLTGDALSTDVMHLTTSGHHSHGQFVDNQNPPADFAVGSRFLVLDNLVHDFFEEKEKRESN